MELEPVARDANAVPMFDRGTELGTKRFTSIDTDGTAITLPCDCKELLIACDEGANAWSVTGTITGATDACVVPAESLVLPVCAESGDEPLTVKAISGTVNVSVFILR